MEFDELLHEVVASLVIADNDFQATRCKQCLLAQKRLVLANDNAWYLILGRLAR